MKSLTWFQNYLNTLNTKRGSKLGKTKVTTIVGTRPEIIRMSEIIKKFDTVDADIKKEGPGRAPLTDLTRDSKPYSAG